MAVAAENERMAQANALLSEAMEEAKEAVAQERLARSKLVAAGKEQAATLRGLEERVAILEASGADAVAKSVAALEQAVAEARAQVEELAERFGAFAAHHAEHGATKEEVAESSQGVVQHMMDELAIRDEALRALQEGLDEARNAATTAAEDAAMSRTVSTKAAQTVSGLVANSDAKIALLTKELRAVKVTQEGKADTTEVAAAVRMGVLPKADKVAMDAKADRVWVQALMKTMASELKHMEEDNDTQTALSKLRRELDRRTEKMAERTYVAQLFDKIEATMDNFANREDFIAHMNVMKGLMDSKAKQEDIDTALLIVKRQLEEMEEGVPPKVGAALAKLQGTLKRKANKSDLIKYTAGWVVCSVRCWQLVLTVVGCRCVDVWWQPGDGRGLEWQWQ